MPEASIIIPTLSNKVPLEACLQSLIHQSLGRDRFEITIVNNGSQTHSDQFLKPIIERVDPNIRIIEAGRNLGFAGGCALGVENATGEIFFFHNDDTVSDPTWLALAVAEWKKTPDVGVITCRIVNACRPILQGEGARLVYPNGNFWQTGHGEPDSPNPQPAPAPRPEEEGKGLPPRNILPHNPAVSGRDLTFFSGDIWATPRSVWSEVGGLSHAYYPGYYEDTEYGLRCRRLGYRLRLLDYVICSHHGSLTLGNDNPRYWRTFHRSRYLFLLRNRLPHRWSEIAKAEFAWWTRYRAGGHPGPALMGLISALPNTPSALFDRRRFENRMK